MRARDRRHRKSEALAFPGFESWLCPQLLRGPAFTAFMFDLVFWQQVKRPSVCEKRQAEEAQNGCAGIKRLSSDLLLLPCTLVVNVLKLVRKCHVLILGRRPSRYIQTATTVQSTPL